jgi:ATP-dependent Lon protease
VQKILDDSHFGLEKIKERIVEYLAILARNPKGKSPILCLVGPPGVGKTSLAKSIAVALNKKFIKVALGGVHDESEIRGHRRTYLGSMPGRIIKGIRQAGVINPIILLDEIDKMSNDGQHGDPGNALLEVLDPEQNTMFNDNYIEENYDLSNVLFIATANYIEQIPEPLHDRLEIIELTTYTELEKLSIAKNYLTKRIEEYTAITTKQLHFTDDGIKFIINHYTREAGVRELERQMNKIARKFAIKLQADEKLVLKVTTDVVREYLGKIIYEYNVKDKIALPGIVNGMAYTSAGGDLLPLEVTYFDGKGDITITGNLKETMKESAQVALGYVRTNAVGFGISKDFDFSKINIHIHVPNGGVPNDGPSAGVALTTALISSLTKRPVSTHIAMTGEIMLRGKVGIIGGVREKVISAFRAGVNEIFLPKDDERYLDDVPKEIKKEITFHLVENYLEIYNLVFNKKILPVNIKDKLRKN